MNQPFTPEMEQAITAAWHLDSARASLTRWLEVRRKEQWGEIPASMSLLVKLFGASWYFTRYLFFRGPKGAELVDHALAENFSSDRLRTRLALALQEPDPEQGFERLRLLKNEIMLQILLVHLNGRLDQEQTEGHLTMLADLTLEMALQISGLHEVAGCRLAVLGMGRMAGYEMTFGSDLDLIFLFEAETDEIVAATSRKVRLLLRHLAVASSAGLLYEVDMRLRPHGTAGALLTANRAFLEYHRAEKEIWERQMMTRCRCVYDERHLGRDTLALVLPHIYASYDAEDLRREIAAMRQRVLTEKGSPRNKLDIKRGKGGIMDIDFLTHYLQLKHGAEVTGLRTCSTRHALRVLAESRMLAPETVVTLLQAYAFLKSVESCVRIFDMKPISTIPADHRENVAAAMATGFGRDTEAFMENYLAVTRAVRSEFEIVFAER
jgi:glutamate-ammonia-ligase adenylyltransferase